MYMTFSVTDMTSQSDNDTLHANGESVFMRLMTTAKKAKERKLPGFLGEESGNSKNKLYNSVNNWLKKNNLTFSAGCVDTLGNELVATLTNTFWYIDGYLKRYPTGCTRVYQKYFIHSKILIDPRNTNIANGRKVT